MDYSPFYAQTPQPYQFMGMPPTPSYSGEEKVVVSRFCFFSPLRSHAQKPLACVLRGHVSLCVSAWHR